MSYTLNYTGSEIDDILDRAAPGGAIDQALATKQDALTFDAVPTEGSTNPAESGGIYDAIQAGGAAALAAFATDSVSGDVVSFPDGASNIPVKAFTGSIIPAQSGSGDPAPDNVRPISGWTGANITHNNANMFLALPSQSGTKRSAPIGVNAGTVYTIETSVDGYRTSTNAYVEVFDRGGYMLGYYTSGGNINLGIDSTHPLTFTAPAGAAYCKFVFFKSGVTTCPLDPSNTYMHEGNAIGSIVAGTTSTILLDFGQTVYAGTLTALGGGLWKIQPTHAIIDLSTAAYTINTQTTGKLFNFAKSDMSRTAGLTGWAEAYQQSFVSAARDMPDYSFLIRSDANAVLVRTDGTETTLPTGNLVYPLATLPDPITITGEDLQTLLGANTVWTDVGAITGMTYRADTALYIDKKLGA